MMNKAKDIESNEIWSAVEFIYQNMAFCFKYLI